MWQYHPVLLLFQLGTFISLGIAGYSLYRLRTYGWRVLEGTVGLFAFHNAIWNFAATAKSASTVLETKLLMYKLEFFGSAVTPTLALLLALAYLGYDRWLTPRVVGGFAFASAAAIVLVIVNPSQAMIADPELVQASGIWTFEHAFPPLFTTYLAWALGTALTAGLLVGHGAFTGRVREGPGILVSAAILLPTAFVVIKVGGLYPPGGRGLNVTPAVNTASLAMIAVAIGRYRLFDLRPIARDQAFDLVDDGYLLTDEDGHVVDVNPSAGELLGIADGAELLARPVDEVIPDARPEESEQEVLIESGERTVQVERVEVQHGRRKTGRIYILHDVTDRLHRERQLEILNRVLRHDVGNAASHVLGYVDLLSGEDVGPERRRELRRIIRHAGLQITRLTGSARAIAQSMQEDGLDVHPVDLSAIVREEVHTAEKLYEGLEICLDLDGPCWVRGSELLTTVVANLIHNAVQHSTDDTVEVEISLRETSDGLAELRVADDGPGVPDEQKDVIFGREEKGLESSGTGMGLYLARHVARECGGSTWVEDNEPTGAIFVVQLTSADAESEDGRRGEPS